MKTKRNEETTATVIFTNRTTVVEWNSHTLNENQRRWKKRWSGELTYEENSVSAGVAPSRCVQTITIRQLCPPPPKKRKKGQHTEFIIERSEWMSAKRLHRESTATPATRKWRRWWWWRSSKKKREVKPGRRSGQMDRWSSSFILAFSSSENPFFLLLSLSVFFFSLFLTDLWKRK